MPDQEAIAVMRARNLYSHPRSCLISPSIVESGQSEFEYGAGEPSDRFDRIRPQQVMWITSELWRRRLLYDGGVDTLV
jgi:hypothetical protein